MTKCFHTVLQRLFIAPKKHREARALQILPGCDDRGAATGLAMCVKQHTIGARHCVKICHDASRLIDAYSQLQRALKRVQPFISPGITQRTAEHANHA